eukprot:785695-Lingulodinium_polyedra.AAC.1
MFCDGAIFCNPARSPRHIKVAFRARQADAQKGISCVKRSAPLWRLLTGFGSRRRMMPCRAVFTRRKRLRRTPRVPLQPRRA